MIHVCKDKCLHFTPRDYEVIQAVGEGLSNKEIASKLALAERTIKNRLSLLFLRAGVKDRTQLALYAWHIGLLDQSVLYR